jgi:hypothetical protein
MGTPRPGPTHNSRESVLKEIDRELVALAYEAVADLRIPENKRESALELGVKAIP